MTENSPSGSGSKLPTAHQTLDERTTVPLTWVVGIVLFLLTGFGTILSAYTWLDNRFDGVFSRLDKMEEKAGDRFRRSDMVSWVSDLREQNPAIVIPDLPPKRKEN